MEQHKIILCTTFREFDGSDNAKIQELFLESIKSQEYEDYILVVTTFGEKNVQKKLKDLFGDKAIVINETLDGYRYSLSSVILNGLEYARKYEGSILVWCTCDIIFQSNYFTEIIRRYSPSLVATTHPNIISHNLEDYYKGVNSWVSNACGFDVVFFATEFLLQNNVERIFREYYFYDWGLFEHFLIGIALQFSANMINFINFCDVFKIANDREASNDTDEFIRVSMERNREVTDRFIEAEGVDKGILDLLFCHKKFRIIKHTIRYDYFSFREELPRVKLYILASKVKRKLLHAFKSSG